MTEKKEFVKPKADFSVLVKDRYVSKWIENYTSDPQSRLRVLNDYCNYLGKTPEQLILEHYEDILRKPLEKTHIAKKQLKRYFEYLINDKLISHNAAVQYVYSKIMSFFSQNDVRITLKKGEKPTMEQRLKKRVIKDLDGKILRNKKEIFKKIRDTLKTIRDKALLLCKLSTGADDVDLFNLTINDFEEGKDSDFKICYIEGNRQKPQGNPRFQGFLNNEAFELVEMYLNERLQHEGALKSTGKLFVSNKAREGVYGTIKAQAFAEAIRNATKTLGLKNVTPKYFRSWFKTILTASKIPKDIVSRLMGHSGTISIDYEQIFDDPELFMEYYIEKINPLTCLGNGNIRTKHIENKVSEMEKIIANLTIENESLKSKMNEFEEFKQGVEGFLEEIREIRKEKGD